MAKRRRVKEEEVEERNLLWEETKVILCNSAKCLSPSELKTMWKSGFERRMYLASVSGNPLVLYYLTHNKYITMPLSVEYYIGVALLGYFVQKGVVKTFMANGGIKLENKRTWRDETPRSLERLKAILSDIGAGAWFEKTTESDVETRHFFKCSMHPQKLSKMCNDIEHKLELKKNSLSITNDKGVTSFAIAKAEEVTYKIDDIVAKNRTRPAGELPFILGIEYSTGKIVIKDMVKIMHMLIGGRTGMGKSTTLEAIIESLMYWNQNIAWYMNDFTMSALLKYSDFSNVAYYESDFANVYKMLTDVYDVYKHRMNLFGAEKIENVQQYNEEHPNSKLPYVLCVTDEASGFLTRFGKDEFSKIDLLMKDLLRMGRKYGMFVIHATQRCQATDYPIAWRTGMSRLGHSMMELEECQALTPSKEIADSMLKLRRGEFYLTEFDGVDIVKIKACFRKKNVCDKLYKILKKGYSKNEDITENKEKNIENETKTRLRKQAI